MPFGTLLHLSSQEQAGISAGRRGQQGHGTVQAYHGWTLINMTVKSKILEDIGLSTLRPLSNTMRYPVMERGIVVSLGVELPAKHH